MLSTLHVWRVVVFLYTGSHRLSPNLTDMCQKPSACFGLRMDTMPMTYQRTPGAYAAQVQRAQGGHLARPPALFLPHSTTSLPRMAK
jgi:hypothetical protein